MDCAWSLVLRVSGNAPPMNRAIALGPSSQHSVHALGLRSGVPAHVQPQRADLHWAGGRFTLGAQRALRSACWENAKLPVTLALQGAPGGHHSG